MGLEKLSDQCLVETYNKAIDLDLSKDFIYLLEQEIDNRKISVSD